MRIYSLYVKVHKITGVRYLGQTFQDPFVYRGSGKDWVTHLSNFGNEVETIILLQTNDRSQRNYWGRYYSVLFNIVGSMDDFGNKIWANRIPETGGGGAKRKVKRDKKKLLSKKERSDRVKIALAKPEVIEKRKRLYTDQKFMKNARERQTKYMNSVHGKLQRSKQIGLNAARIDKNIYEFVHRNGTVERCTRYELITKYNLIKDRPNICAMIKGKKKTVKGWKINH